MSTPLLDMYKKQLCIKCSCKAYLKHDYERGTEK